MVTFNSRVDALAQLGLWLHDVCAGYPEGNESFRKLLQNQHIYNPWLVEPFILKSFRNWADRLSSSNIQTFVSKYIPLGENRTERHIAVIGEENVPLSGFHDFICIMLAGHHFYARNVNHSNELLYFVTQQLIEICPGLAPYIHWCEVFPKKMEAYLIFLKPNEPVQKSYFQKKNSLIREKMVSVAIVNGNETEQDFKRFGEDIFTNFGMGNHAIRKVFVPEGYNFTRFFESIEENSWVYTYNRYANNYDYHRSVFLMERIKFLDNGFLVLRGSKDMEVPIGCLYFEEYSTLESIKKRIASVENVIENVCSTLPVDGAISPGQSHHYPLWAFEGQKDTIQFLINDKNYA